MHIVESICESLDLGVEDAKLLIQFVASVCLRLFICESLDLFGKGGPPVVVVDLGDKGGPPVVVVVLCNGSSIQCADIVRCSPETPVVVVVSFTSGSIQHVDTVSCFPQKPRIRQWD